MEIAGHRLHGGFSCERGLATALIRGGRWYVGFFDVEVLGKLLVRCNGTHTLLKCCHGGGNRKSTPSIPSNMSTIYQNLEVASYYLVSRIRISINLWHVLCDGGSTKYQNYVCFYLIATFYFNNGTT
jgi:hypothetical protein